MNNIGQNNPAYRHGHCGRMTGQSSEYMTWSAMIQRCTNPHNKAYHDYGDRNITVCNRWKQFENFISDVGPRPRGFTLERVNNDLGYSKENCKWVPRVVNNNNKRNNILITHNEITQTAAQWSRKSAVTYRTFMKRLERGWSLIDALSKPSLAI